MNEFLKAFHTTLWAGGILLITIGLGLGMYKIWVRFLLSNWWYVHQPTHEVILIIMFNKALKDSQQTFQAFTSWLKKTILGFGTFFLNVFRKVPWFTLVFPAIYIMPPLLVLKAKGYPLEATLGIMAAGAIFGAFCTPLVMWQIRPKKLRTALGLALCTTTGGAWLAIFVIAGLIAISSS